LQKLFEYTSRGKRFITNGPQPNPIKLPTRNHIKDVRLKITRL